MFQEIGLWCVVLPVTAILVGFVIALIARRITPEVSHPFSTGAFINIAWCAAVIIAIGGRQGWAWWPEDIWQRAIWPITITSVLLAMLHHASGGFAQFRWPVACIGAAITAYCIQPKGDAWEDVLPIVGDWMLLVTTSSFLNVWSLYQIAHKNAERWVGLVAVASISAPLIYAAGVYAGLAEIIAAAVVATLVVSVIAMFADFSLASVVIYPVSLFVAAFTASARFYSYDQPNPYILAIVLFLPTIVYVVDILLASRSQPVRILAAAIVAIVSIGILAWFLNPEADPEEW